MSLHLSRLLLNPRSRQVQCDLANCHELHRTIMSAFPDLPDVSARERLGVLYRLDEERGRGGAPILLVQSQVEPGWSRLPAGYLAEMSDGRRNPASKPVDEQYGALRDGVALAFRLKANPTKKIETKSGPDGERRNGRRVELGDEESQIRWLRRKAEESGFELLRVGVRPGAAEGKVGGTQAPPGRPTRPRRLTFGAVLFDGALRVTDAERFRDALWRGLGPGKAYGFGLLSVAPLR